MENGVEIHGGKQDVPMRQSCTFSMERKEKMNQSQGGLDTRESSGKKSSFNEESLSDREELEKLKEDLNKAHTRGAEN